MAEFVNKLEGNKVEAVYFDGTVTHKKEIEDFAEKWGVLGLNFHPKAPGDRCEVQLSDLILNGTRVETKTYLVWDPKELDLALVPAARFQANHLKVTPANSDLFAGYKSV